MHTCAICKLEKNSKFDVTYDLRNVLKDLGIEGTHAHPRCINSEFDKRRKRDERRGIKRKVSGL